MANSLTQQVQGGAIFGGTPTAAVMSLVSTAEGYIVLPSLTVSVVGYSFTSEASVTLPDLLVTATAIAPYNNAVVNLPSLGVSAAVDYSSLGQEGQASIAFPPITLISAVLDGLDLALAFNLENAALTEYSNFYFNSFALINGTYLGASESGLMSLTGDDDNGVEIDSDFRFAQNNFGANVIKRAWNAYVSLTIDGEFKLILVDGEGKSHDALVLVNSKDGMKTQRCKLSHIVRSNYFSLEFKNLNGADFEVDSMEFTAELTNRRA